MTLYIRALGFSQFDTKEKATIIVTAIIKEQTNKRVWANEEEKFVEYYRGYGEDFGLLVRGILADDGELKVQSLLPYAKGRYSTEIHEVDVVKQAGQEIYHGFSEELETGTPISFLLQNLEEYRQAEEKEMYVDNIRLIGFCTEATVILPIDKDATDTLLEDEEEKIRGDLLKKARNGDEASIDKLDNDAVEASEVLQERLKKEDILSILEGFFVPAGDMEDIYSILGEIKKVETIINSKTEEKIYRVQLKCMNIILEVFINEMDLVGDPTVGMRMKCTSWIHGTINFDTL